MPRSYGELEIFLLKHTVLCANESVSKLFRFRIFLCGLFVEEVKCLKLTTDRQGCVRGYLL